MGQNGFIYAIGMDEMPFVKIGRTNGTVEQRLVNMQTAHPLLLKVHAAVYVENHIVVIERVILRLLEADRHRGEWFALKMDQPDLEALIVKARALLEMPQHAENDEEAPPLLENQASLTLGHRIGILRRWRKLSQVQLAAQSIIPLSTIERVETHMQRDMQGSYIVSLAKVLGVSTDMVLGVVPLKRPDDCVSAA